MFTSCRQITDLAIAPECQHPLISSKFHEISCGTYVRDMEQHMKNEDRVLIVFIEWEKSESDVRSKLQDLYNSNIITYAKAVFFEKTRYETISLFHIIIRFTKPKSKRQLLKHFPAATLKKIISWKKQKGLITTLAKDIGKIIEIGNDNCSKQYAKSLHYEERSFKKRGEKVSKSSNQSLYDIVELKKWMDKKATNTNQDLTSFIFNERPDLIRTRKEGFKLANELSQNERVNKMRQKAESVEWRQWQKWFFDKATNQHINPREVLVVYDPVGNTGKSFLRKMFGILYSNQTCKLQNGHSRGMFHSAGKTEDLRYVIMDLGRSDCRSVNYNAIEQIKNGDFDTCKYNNTNVCVEPPFFAIFTNFKLDWWSLSLDRWSLLYLNNDNTFKYYERFDPSMKDHFNH